MPSTYTGSGIELIGDGEQSGSWGTTTNNNMQILNRLISEAGVIALAGTTHTLTISDGTLSDGQYSVLVFGGSPSGTNTVTINPNDAKRVFIVSNTSGQSVVLTQGSGGNVTIANNGKAIVYCDGAGSGAAVVDVSPATPTLAAIGLLTPTDGNFIVGNGSTWVAESGNVVLQSLGVTATAAELNVLDGISATTAELNYTDGVTSNIQTQLDAKAATATTISAGAGLTGGGDLTTNRTLSHADTSSQTSVDNSGTTVIQDVTLDTYGHVTALGSKALALTDFGLTATSTELNYTDGVTSNIQTQLDNKQPLDAELTAISGLTPTDGNFIVGDGTTWVAESGNTVLQSIGVTATTTELNYVDGVTSSIQTQLNAKAATSTSVSAGAGLTGGGDLSTSRTISHADTSSQSSVNNSGSTFIQDITLDTYGHVTGIGSATISFPAPTTAQVLSATAGASAGDVGTYALCWPASSTLRNEGTSIAGSSLRYASTFAYANVGYSSRVPSGTWRCMGVTGYLDGSSGYGSQSDKQTTVWLRIA